MTNKISSDHHIENYNQDAKNQTAHAILGSELKYNDKYNGYTLNTNENQNTVVIRPKILGQGKGSRKLSFVILVVEKGQNECKEICSIEFTSKIRNESKAVTNLLLKKDGNCILHDIAQFATNYINTNNPINEDKLFDSEKKVNPKFKEYIYSRIKTSQDYDISLTPHELTKYSTFSSLIYNIKQNSENFLLKIGSCFSKKIKQNAVKNAYDNDYTKEDDLIEMAEKKRQPAHGKKRQDSQLWIRL